MDFISGLLSSIIGGGATGILGIAVQRIADYKNRQLDIEITKANHIHEANMREVDAKIMAQEWAARTKVAEVEGAVKVDVADSQVFAASFNEPTQYSSILKPNEKQGWLLVILDFIRGLVRPVLTVYLCVLTTLVYLQARSLLGTQMESVQAFEVLQKVVDTIMYLTTTCVLWWYGTRNKGPTPKLGK